MNIGWIAEARTPGVGHCPRTIEGPGVFGYQLDFDRPAYLLVLLALPVAWFWGRHSLAAMGRLRHALAFLLRAAVITGIALALAEVHVVRTSDRLAVIYVLDRSLSVSPERSAAAIEFINASRAQFRNAKRGDVAGVVVFGREAAVELPPLDDDVPLVEVETPIDGESTDLAAALRLARACFPSQCAKRIVVLSDGNENEGSAIEEARAGRGRCRHRRGSLTPPARRRRGGGEGRDAPRSAQGHAVRRPRGAEQYTRAD